MTYRKKLIEVALPLEAINVASAREKSIRHGHPSTLHLWWARRPLAACRAVLFSSLIDDPSEYLPDEESARVERERLFDLIEELVKWDNINNEELLDKAKLEIARSVARNLDVDVPVGKEAIREFLATKAPPVLDPFAGGGSIPLEAQRLGLRAYASDFNPVAVLINKALIEIPPKFANMPPIHPPEEPVASKKKGKKGEGTLPLFAHEWKGAQGLAEDVRYYGKWMRDEAFKRIGHLYPPVTVTKEMLAERRDLKEHGLKVGERLTVDAWIWARTIQCPNPACELHTPLVKSFWLSTKKGERYWVEPILQQNAKSKKLIFRIGFDDKKQPQDGTVGRSGAICISCGAPITLDYIRSQGKMAKMDQRLIAIVAVAKNRRVYLSPTDEHEEIVSYVKNDWMPDQQIPNNPFSLRPPLYGLDTFADLFSPRQLVAMSTFVSLVNETKTVIEKTLQVDNTYSAAVATYLGLAASKLADRNSTIASWDVGSTSLRSTFARQAIPMTWDYCEVNPFEAMGSFDGAIDWIYRLLVVLPSTIAANVQQMNAIDIKTGSYVISTDPPYYDNIDYADLSDYFYIWLRKALKDIYPDLFVTVLVPKSGELVATPYRFDGDKNKAKQHFENGLATVFNNFTKLSESQFPITIYYAFKQMEGNDSVQSTNDQQEDYASTGWETILESLLTNNWQITGTWPMRTEGQSRAMAQSKNALASSVILVCRVRDKNIGNISRREFLSTLKKELAPALRELQQGSIAPVDLAQASIGPGMAVYSRYSSVLEADGNPMSVRTALTLINQALDEYLSEQEGEYDADTRWALSWYEQFGHNEAAFGVAETLSKAKNTSVNGLVEAGILEARGGKVHLLGRDELDHEWDPTQDKRPTAWEAVQHLIYALENEGEESAAGLLSKLGSIAEPARDLAYRLYTVCERKGWAQDALGYNMLVVAWPRLKELAAKQKPMQENLL